MATHYTIGADANVPATLAAFCALALYSVLEPGYNDPDGASIVDPAGLGLAIGFLRVSERERPRTNFTSTSA